MRNTIARSVSIVSFRDGDNGAGINLGADYCAEHEWGIKGLKHRFGIGLDSKAVGIDARKVTRLPHDERDPGAEVLALCDTGKELILFLTSFFGDEQRRFVSCATNRVYRYKGKAPVYIARTVGGRFGSKSWDTDPESFVTAWDERSFAIAACGEKGRALLTRIAKAFDRQDVLIGTGKSMPFRNGGLVMLIASEVPEEVRTSMREADEDHNRLQALVDATGIYKLLADKGKRYYALSPRWEDENKTDVVFWLNPQEQQENNYGWYGLGALQLWAEGKGPIPKQIRAAA